MHLSRPLQRLTKELKRYGIGKKRLLIFSIVSVLIIAFYLFILRDLPSPTTLSSPNKIPQSTLILDRNDKLLYTIYTERNRAAVPLNSLPLYVKQATIAIEDKDFYRHGAIDPRGIIRAIYEIVAHRNLQGGSTITQQLVKTALLSSERTIPRKIKEFFLALVIEQIYTKDQILELYLNNVPYGGTAYGIEAAAHTYFGKGAKDLTLAQAALLAALPSAPSVYSPFGSHPELGQTRKREVLSKMQEQGYISQETRKKTEEEPFKYAQAKDTIKAPHFVFYVRDLLIKKYGEKVVEEGGLRIKTSLDLDMQDFAQDTVAKEVVKLRGLLVSNGDALVTNPATGEILAMVGSSDYFDAEHDGNVNVTLSHRQPGSSIKPINYALGLLNGYSAATPFVDKRICFPGAGQAPYCPVNYDGKFHGLLLMRDALGSSINVPAVKMLKLNGVEKMTSLATQMGITSFTDPARYGLSLTLGGGEVSMIDMAVAFGVFANGGYRMDLHPILKVTDSSGRLLEEYKAPLSPIFGKKVLPEAVAFIISNILADNNARAIAFGTDSALVVKNHIVSVKTGTTDDKRDNWTIGYTPSLLVATWVGNNDNTPMHPTLTSGVTGAAPIWQKIMAKFLQEKKQEPPKIPDSVVGISVCATSGKLPQPEESPNRCPTRFEYFLKGNEPKEVDNSVKQVFIDTTTSDLAREGQTENVEQREAVVVTDPTGDSWCLTCPHPELSEPSPTPTP